MVMLILQTALLVLAAYALGCLAGALLRRLLAPEAALAPAYAPAAPAPPPVPVVPAEAPAAAPYAWHAMLDGDTVVLGGSVPSQAARANLVDVAHDIAPTAAVRDTMVERAGAPEGWAPAARAGLKALATLSRGRVALCDLTLSIEGPSINDRAYRQMKALGNQPPGRGFKVDATKLEPPLPEPAAPEALPSEAEIAARLAALPKTATDAEKADAVGTRPAGLQAPRGAVADDLKRIRGIGPKNEAILNGLGIHHFDQIAAWTPAEVLWIDTYIAFPGRIAREQWIEQAEALARGEETGFSRRVDRGEVPTSL